MLILLALACTGEPEVEDHWAPPDEWGPWTVGTEEHLAAGSSGVDLPVQLWFPARRADDEPYRYDGLLEGQAMEDGVPACGQPRPVVVFSHGNGGIRYQSHSLTEHLASHGYLVVAPDHVGNTLADLDTVPRGEMAVRRPTDVADAFDWLVDQGADPDSFLHGCLDPDAGYAVAGHSFGGYTAVATAGATLDLEGMATLCAEASFFLCGAEVAWAEAYPGDDSGDLSDPRVWATIPLAPAGALAFGAGLGEVAVPALVVGGYDDDVTPWDTEVQPIYEGLQSTPRYLAGIDRAGHFSFADLCLPMWNGCSDDDLPPEQVHAITNTVATALLDVVRGEDRSAPYLPPEHEALTWEGVE